MVQAADGKMFHSHAIVAAGAANLNSFDWIVPTTLTAMDGYKIRVVGKHAEGYLVGYSKDTFKVSSKFTQAGLADPKDDNGTSGATKTLVMTTLSALLLVAAVFSLF
jgi:hypothetical protein